MGLALGGTGIDDVSIPALASSLTSTYTIKEITLFNNSITAKGAVQLAEVLRHCKITLLSMAYNPIGDRGGRALFEATPLSEYMDFRGCKLSEELKDSLIAQWME